jgi:hypothetical protein
MTRKPAEAQQKTKTMKKEDEKEQLVSEAKIRTIEDQWNNGIG